MLPSMPILFSRESQDAFGNKIEQSTSFFNHNFLQKPVINPEPPPPVKPVHVAPKTTQNKAINEASTSKSDNTSIESEKPKESAIIKSYYSKVHSRFSSHPNMPTNKFVQFREILKSFDPSKETPVDLYKKLEKLFGDEHKDILEEFLLFLKPGQAAQVGRFMDRFMLVQMTSFIEQLQSTFARKPTVLRKVLRALTTGINSGSSEDMKKRVQPHLRSSPRLAMMFKALFPDERPPDSVYETNMEVMNEDFLTNGQDYDVWEFQHPSASKKKPEAKQNLDTVYLHGRVFLQHGRMLRTASVTYPYSKEPYRVHSRRLLPDHILPPLESDDERTSPKKKTKLPPKKTKKPIKTKPVKDVNDNNKKDSILNSPKVKGKAKAKTTAKKDVLDKRTNVGKKKDDAKPKPVKIEADKPTEVGNEDNKKKEAEVTQTEVKSNSWTRDEDKAMLQVIKVESGSEQIFVRIRELLPHRSPVEIKERFCHVMTLLQQMAVGEVT